MTLAPAYAPAAVAGTLSPAYAGTKAASTLAPAYGATATAGTLMPAHGLPAAPVASSVSISGTTTEGETLTGSYTYTDPQGLPESGTTFQWYRADDGSGTNSAPIGGATAQTYELVAADVSKFVSFGVTPSNGFVSGSQVLSVYEGPVASAGGPSFLYLRTVAEKGGNPEDLYLRTIEEKV